MSGSSIRPPFGRFVTSYDDIFAHNVRTGRVLCSDSAKDALDTVPPLSFYDPCHAVSVRDPSVVTRVVSVGDPSVVTRAVSLGDPSLVSR